MKSLISILKSTFLVIIINTSLLAQDGEALFKAKCNSCHLVDKASTGPLLKGVMQKWSDAGEADLLTEWMKNSATLIASGKSKMANEIKGFNAMVMPAQDVSKVETEAILAYIDSYTPPAAEPSISASVSGETGVTKEKELVTNYKQNITLFYWLLFAILILIISILIISSSILNLVKSDSFKNRKSEVNLITKNNSTSNSTLIAIIASVGFMAYGNPLFALSTLKDATLEGSQPWLKVENIDLYYLITINIILIFVLFYLRRMFNQLIGLILPQQEKVETKKRQNKLNKILNDIVPIEEEHTILMHHEYDGIRELDNNLPPWWVWGFVATIIFAIVYLSSHHIFKTADSQVLAYEKDMKRSAIEVKAYLSKMSMNVDETNATLMTKPEDLSSGKALFETNCVTCHNPKGEGNIGPNLTDKNWIYGFDIKEVFKTIKTGTPNGMPEHNSKFNPIQIQQVSSYVLSLTEVKGKDAQGEIIEK